jgi:hypothetical protein
MKLVIWFIGLMCTLKDLLKAVLPLQKPHDGGVPFLNKKPKKVSITAECSLYSLPATHPGHPP